MLTLLKLNQFNNFVLKCILLILQRSFILIINCFTLINYYYHWWMSRHFQFNKNLSKLTKKPRHLAIGIGVVDLDHISLDKVSELIQWCRYFQIESLTLYHQSTNKRLKSFQNQFTDIVVSFVSLQASHHSLVDVCRTFCAKKQSVDTDIISDQLKQHYSSPDPDLLLTFNGWNYLNAFPIWQIRLTEIEFMKCSFNHLTINEFFDKLYYYSHCEQRFGR